MKISELNIKDFLSRNTDAETNSYLILNYGENDTDPSVTYRISLEELSNMIISNHKLLKYASENKNLISRKYASNAYSDTAAVGQYIDTTDRTVLDSAVTAVSYDGTNKKLTSSVRGGTATDIVTVATLKNDMELNNVNNTSDANKPVSTAQQTALDLKMNNTARGAVNGVASLDENGKVPAAQLPSYVDDIIEGYYYQGGFYKEVGHTTSIDGESGKIYVDLTENGPRQVYRWSGTAYVAIPIGLALGETASTAYAGDKGAAAYAHAVTNKGVAAASGLYKITTNSEGHVTAATAAVEADIMALHTAHTAQSSGLYKITIDAKGHVSAVTAVEKSDITGLGIPGSDTTYEMDGTYDASTNKVATVSTVTNAVSGLYTKPVGGIPSTDLADTYFSIPTLPTTDGTYILQVVIATGEDPVFSWIEQTT